MRSSRLLLALVAGLIVASAPAAARRIALVIGNDSYRHVEPLQNARADARAIAATLKDLGFDVTLRQDLTLSDMKAALRELKTRTGAGDDIVFYFSGHGVQFEGTNYLVPIDIVANDALQVADDSVPLQRVLDDLSDQKANFSLAIVDACRDNPFKGSGRSLGGRGLAPVTAVNGQMVLYSAGAGQQALDRLGPDDRDPNGVFTRVLLKEIRQPGVPVDRVLKNVQHQVIALAKGVGRDQVPALYDQSVGDFYFVAATATAPVTTSAPTTAVAHVDPPLPSASSAPAAATGQRGPFPGYTTSTLMPGTRTTGELKLSADGLFDYESSNGHHMHGTLMLSDLNNVSGLGVATLPKVLGVRPRRFADGSSSTPVQLKGRIADGKLQGTYVDKFETGDFVVELGSWP